MSQEKIKVGLVGYGRLGKAYAHNLKNYIPNADLIAVCSLAEDEILHARRHLQVPYVYSSYEKMLEHTELDAIYGQYRNQPSSQYPTEHRHNRKHTDWCIGEPN